jgi:hypothetical protein
MKKGQILPIMMLQVLMLVACAQPQKLVKKLHAFSMLPRQGTVQVDEMGNERPVPSDTLYVVFAETATDSITWKAAWIGDRYFSVVAERVNGSISEPGLDPASGKPVTLQPAKGRSLYRLVLQAAHPVTAEEHKVRAGVVLLSGTFRNKPFELQTEPIRFLTGNAPY